MEAAPPTFNRKGRPRSPRSQSNEYVDTRPFRGSKADMSESKCEMQKGPGKQNDNKIFGDGSPRLSHAEKIINQHHAAIDMLKLNLDLSRTEQAAAEEAILEIRECMKTKFSYFRRYISDTQWELAQVLRMDFSKLLNEERVQRAAETAALRLRLEVVERMQVPFHMRSPEQRVPKMSDDRTQVISVNESEGTGASTPSLFTVHESGIAVGGSMTESGASTKASTDTNDNNHNEQGQGVHLLQALASERRRSAELMVESARRSVEAVRDAFKRSDCGEQKIQEAIVEAMCSKCIESSLELDNILTEHMNNTTSGLRADINDELTTRIGAIEALTVAMESSVRSEFKRVSSELSARVGKLETMQSSDQLSARLFALQAESTRTLRMVSSLEERLLQKGCMSKEVRISDQASLEECMPPTTEFCEARNRLRGDIYDASASPVSSSEHGGSTERYLPRELADLWDRVRCPPRAEDFKESGASYASPRRREHRRQKRAENNSVELASESDLQNKEDMEIITQSEDLDFSTLGISPSMPQIQTNLKIVPPQNSRQYEAREACDTKFRMATIPGPNPAPYQGVHSNSQQELKCSSDPSLSHPLNQSKSMPAIPPIDFRKGADHVSAQKQVMLKLSGEHRESLVSPGPKDASPQQVVRKSPTVRAAQKLSAASVPVNQSPRGKQHSQGSYVTLRPSEDVVSTSERRAYFSGRGAHSTSNEAFYTLRSSQETPRNRDVTLLHDDYMRSAVLGVKMPVSARMPAAVTETQQTGPATHR